VPQLLQLKSNADSYLMAVGPEAISQHTGSPLSIGRVSRYGYGRASLTPVDELPLF
jgi:hypothetical protein